MEERSLNRQYKSTQDDDDLEWWEYEKTNSNTKRGAKIDILEWNAPESSRDAITASESETEEDQKGREGTEALGTPTTANIALETSSQPFTYIIYWWFVASTPYGDSPL